MRGERGGNEQRAEGQVGSGRGDNAGSVPSLDPMISGTYEEMRRTGGA
jgi:hypothetical protein